SPTNELPARFSNLREMFYMDTNPGRAGNNTWLQTLAHEFHHMINYNYHKAAGGQETWLNEGLAEFSGFNAGYGHTVNVVPFLSDPSNSLLEWSSQPRNYGASALFILYLWEHYGGDPLIRAITQNPALSVDAVDVALAAQGSSDRFRQIFDKWTVANYLGDPVSAGGVYGYKSLRFTDDLTPGDVADNKTVFRRPAPTSSFNTYPVSGNGAVNAWAARYYRFTGNAATLTFTFGGIGTARFGVNVVASSSDGFAAGTNAVSRMSLLDGAGGTLTVNGLGSAVRTVLLIPSGQPDDDGPAASAGYQFSGSVTGAAASSPTVTATPSVTASPSPSPSVTPQPSGTPIATPTLAPMPSPTPAPASLTAPADGAVLAGLGAN
ncbi:MAG: hypothetical protein NTZ05_08525, partial [Chloroflexi bacterium]|nr:hypothetical protein [Chloroflexota bacterium]